MNKILLDSHLYIWLLYKPQNIASQTEQLLQTADFVGVSIVSLWELAIKHKLGKLRYPVKELSEGLVALGVELVQLEANHIATYNKINLSHKDPFDTILIAQSVCKEMKLLTADKLLLKSAYPTINAIL